MLSTSAITQKLWPNECQAIEVFIDHEGQEHFYFTKTKKEKGELVIDVIQHFDSIKEIPLEKSCPVMLIMTGKGLLSRNIPAIDEKTDDELIQTLLPNAKPENFLVQRSTFLVYAIRKERIETYTDHLKRRGGYVVGIFLGHVCLEQIAKVIDNASLNEAVFRNKRLSCQDGTLTNVSVSQEEETQSIYIDNIEISSHAIMGFGAALYYFTGSTPHPLTHIISDEISEFKQYQIYKTAGIAGIAFFLVILLINFFVWQSTATQNNELQTSLNASKQQLEKKRRLEDDLKKKQSFLNQAGWMEPSKASFYIDRLISSMPVQIKLTKTACFPVDYTATKKQRHVVYNHNLIEVEGNCMHAVELNPWVHAIKSFEWTKEAIVTDYTYDSKDKIGSFTITIKMR